MSRFSYRGVRWLSIEVIAEEWAKERHKHPSVIAQELQLAIMNKERFSQGQPNGSAV